MTYADRENSAADAQPNELYSFYLGSRVWRFAGGDADVIADSFLYTAHPLQRGRIVSSEESAKNFLEVKMSKTSDFCDQFRVFPPTAVVNLTVRRYHIGLAEYATIWSGRVINVKFGEREMTMRCEPLQTGMSRPVIRMRYQTTCPHVLYGSSCRALRASFLVPVTLIGVADNVLSSSDLGPYATNYFAGGYADWQGPYSLERRFITSSTTSSITLATAFNNIPADADLTLYPGCDHTLTTCNSKFGNVLNYGGQPFYPGANPFSGSPIF